SQVLLCWARAISLRDWSIPLRDLQMSQSIQSTNIQKHPTATKKKAAGAKDRNASMVVSSPASIQRYWGWVAVIFATSGGSWHSKGSVANFFQARVLGAGVLLAIVFCELGGAARAQQKADLPMAPSA